MDVINTAGTIAFLAFIIQYVLERVRGRYTSLDGDIVAATAVVISFALAWAFDLRGGAEVGIDGLPVVLDYLATALVISGVSGYIATSKNAKRAEDPASSLYSG